MSLEPGFIDANVLVYAMDADAPQYEASRALLEAARDPSTPLYVTSQILCEFYSIVTHARRVPKPRSPDDALRAFSGLLAFLHVLPIPARVVEGWLDLLHRHAVEGMYSICKSPRPCRPMASIESILLTPMILKRFANLPL
jgi:predicted nucleic acid-binding protein